MITTHYSPSDYTKGKNAITKEAFYEAILNKKYNTQAKYQSGQTEVDNFVSSVKDGETYTTFTLKYGRKPLATFDYFEEEYESKADFIKDVLAYAKENSEIKEKAWELRKKMSKTNGENAKGGTSLQVAS